MAQPIKYLLDSISEINKKYEEIARITGENFNIFSILKLQYDEVRLHSRILGELLNPYGSHGKNELFLKLFLSTLNLYEDYTQDQIKNATVMIEENIGNISDDYSKGGRIDLVIKFPGNKKEIVIENKIYAIDQFNQLGRYHEQYPNAHILYLTPEEREPSNESLGEKLKLKYKQVVKCITYKNEIIDWLELCHEKTSNFPMLRETILQYINLIKNITNQTMNEQKDVDLINKIISIPENIESAEAIVHVWEKAKYSIIANLKSEIKNIASRLNFNFEIDCDWKDQESKLGKAGTGFWFYNIGDEYCIYFCFENNLEQMLYGIATLNKNTQINEELKKKILEKFPKSDFSDRDSEGWLWVKIFDEYSNTKWKDVSSQIPKSIEIKLTELTNLLNQEPPISLK